LPPQLYFTSGTTGRPKMVELTHRVVATHARGAVREMRLHASDVWLHVAPLYHLVDAFAVYAVTLALGRHVIMRSFSAVETLHCIERERVTVTNMASTMALLCVNSPIAALVDLSSLRMLSCGGSPLPAAAVRRALSVFGTEFCLSYGMTECWCVRLFACGRDPLTMRVRFAVERFQ
jgi:acyl-CoA synthetase (AMP-forming)/AMP-acid ligase II